MTIIHTLAYVLSPAGVLPPMLCDPSYVTTPGGKVDLVLIWEEGSNDPIVVLIG